MRIAVDISAWRRTKWYEYLIRFAVGGVVTVIAALIAKRFGAGIGGLFLAFPAIFPSTATLIASHEKQKKAQAGISGAMRARDLAGADAAGAAMGGIGLEAFAAVTWWMIADHSTPVVPALATLVWLLVSFLVWEGREKLWRGLRRSLRHSHLPRSKDGRVSHQGNRQQN
jgi:hypothetical protein